MTVILIKDNQTYEITEQLYSYGTFSCSGDHWYIINNTTAVTN